MATWLLIFFPALLAGVVQGLTGFGAVIVMMTFFPAILPIAPAAGIAGLSMLASMVGLTYRYRHEFKFKRVIPPFIIYAAVATWSVHLSSVLDTNVMRMMLGGLLIALYLYFTLVKNSDSRQFPWYVAIGFMIISGFFNGLLGIGGPLMALYFLSLSKSIPEYTANIQGFFLIDAFYINSVRVANGILVPHDVPYILVGMVAAGIGTIIAARIANKLDDQTFRKWVYRFIGLSGIYYLFF
ncbi:sulfite exporter TauE/SafE family protein [Pediococcus inopinatus]|uniref:Probable membrane transporter protein n=1 Tax=Pediococcus inopinatus TaxID=114090 RepID=A0ABZ0Q4J4_9LACO|nr:sulfite exporter TauE/SafE family protein [Pediococcus inopinatus]WPC20206.1 sulfite exporter TauE/SafE family protein [Pediococcus inopinatus]WPC21911.1 sulfite exporter TauE/SafE family protein [Pediococcus inopinatus]WPP09158.1 sulfite exporter TauE/SafE family protein [Pediococcus inopinatus]